MIFQPRNETPVTQGDLVVSGYCYTGGGRPLQRVEVSYDGGESWKLATLKQQDPTPAGRLYSWILWEARIQGFDPSTHGEVVARAWDAAANGQPVWPVWNLTGMMNNSYFRVKVAKSASGQGWIFEHPTTWMPKDIARKAEEAEKKKSGSGSFMQMLCKFLPCKA